MRTVRGVHGNAARGSWARVAGRRLCDGRVAFGNSSIHVRISCAVAIQLVSVLMLLSSVCSVDELPHCSRLVDALTCCDCSMRRFVTLTAEGLEPFLGASLAVDYRLIGIANEVIVDVAVQALSLTAFRLYRWWDAQQY